MATLFLASTGIAFAAVIVLAATESVLHGPERRHPSRGRAQGDHGRRGGSAPPVAADCDGVGRGSARLAADATTHELGLLLARRRLAAPT
jgi:hypothetical protein